MSKIQGLFNQQKKQILSMYFTAGYPQLNDTLPILYALKDAGVDLVEIGVPFSDPLADGHIIQKSSQRALQNGMSLNLLFEQLGQLPKDFDLPMLLMSYYNPVYKFGMQKVISKCVETGIFGMIIPDLPFEEYLEKYSKQFKVNGLYFIPLVSPQTDNERLKEIDARTNGFIYAVSSNATTGGKSQIESQQIAYFKRLQSTNLKNPFLIGFGISNKDSFLKACEYAKGAIIGSAFVKTLVNSEKLRDSIKEFVASIR